MWAITLHSEVVDFFLGEAARPLYVQEYSNTLAAPIKTCFLEKGKRWTEEKEATKWANKYLVGHNWKVVQV